MTTHFQSCNVNSIDQRPRRRTETLKKNDLFIYLLQKIYHKI